MNITRQERIALLLTAATLVIHLLGTFYLYRHYEGLFGQKPLHPIPHLDTSMHFLWIFGLFGMSLAAFTIYTLLRDARIWLAILLVCFPCAPCAFASSACAYAFIAIKGWL